MHTKYSPFTAILFFFVQCVACLSPCDYSINSCFFFHLSHVCVRERVRVCVCVCLYASHLFCLYHTLESQSTCGKEVFFRRIQYPDLSHNVVHIFWRVVQTQSLSIYFHRVHFLQYVIVNGDRL